MKYYLELNGVSEKKYIPIRKVVSNIKGLKNIKDNGGSGNSIHNSGDEVLELTTIDDEVNRLNINVGLIKADIEGETYNFLRGSKYTIRKYRPVLIIAVYHNLDELKNSKRFIEEEVKDYVIEFQLHNSCKPTACEINIFAYPKELL